MSLPYDQRTGHRTRGHRGSTIPVHRALHRLEFDRTPFAAGAIVVILVLVGWALAWPAVASLWAWIGRVSLEILAVPASVSVVQRDFVFGIMLDVPRFAAAAASPSRLDLFWGLVVTAILLIVPFFMPDRARPIGYLMRLLAVVQVSSQIVFAVFPGVFPYDVGALTEVSMLANLFLIGLIPLIMGFAYFPLSYGWSRRLAAVILPMLHLTLAVPLLYVGHTWVLHHASLLWMPLLFWAFGLVLSVSTIVTFFGWAASWTPRAPRERPRRPHPRPTWKAVILVFLLAAPAQAEDVTESLFASFDVGSYSDDLGDATSMLVAYQRDRTWVDRWRVDLGVASRFEDTGVGIGASYGRHFGRNRFVSAGFSTGTGDVILPEWRFDVGLRQTGLLNDRLIFDIGYTHIQSKAENSTDGVGAGLIYAIGGGFQVGVDGRIDRGNPGSTTGHTIAGSLLYGIYRTFYANVRFESARVAYVLVGPSDALVEFDSTGVRAGVTWYVRPTRGLALEYSRTDTDFYDVQSIGLRAFTEW